MDKIVMCKENEDGTTERIEFLDGSFNYKYYNPQGQVKTNSETYAFNGKNKFFLIEEYKELGFKFEDELKKVKRNDASVLIPRAL